MPGEVLHELRPALRSGRFLHLAKLGPTRLLGERNSPASCSGENALGPALPARIRTTLASRKLLQNGYSLREIINLLLRVPTILAEPRQRFTYVCHFETPLRLLAGRIVVISAELRYLLKQKICLIRFGKGRAERPGRGLEAQPKGVSQPRGTDRGRANPRRS